MGRPYPRPEVNPARRRRWLRIARAAGITPFTARAATAQACRLMLVGRPGDVRYFAICLRRNQGA